MFSGKQLRMNSIILFVVWTINAKKISKMECKVFLKTLKARKMKGKQTIMEIL